MPRIEAFLRQNAEEIAPFAESVQKMGAALK
jgi:flagellar biosynthesis/type III secretory pathway ATPase